MMPVDPGIPCGGEGAARGPAGRRREASPTGAPRRRRENGAVQPAPEEPLSGPLSRYDDVAAWYDETFRQSYTTGPHSSSALLANLVASRAGRCVDIGCGTGFNAEALAECGLGTTGVDTSIEALGIARTHGVIPVLADAARTPFPDAVVDTVVATHIHTDVDDMAPILREVARLLRVGGRFLYLGTHPCFVGHFVERHADGSRTIHGGYREAGWHHDSPWWGDGVRRRVGARHVPVAELLNGVIAAGLRLVAVAEPEDGNLVPGSFALIAER